MSGMVCYVLNILLSSPSRKDFLCSVFWWGIMPSPLAQALNLPRQHIQENSSLRSRQ